MVSNGWSLLLNKVARRFMMGPYLRTAFHPRSRRGKVLIPHIVLEFFPDLLCFLFLSRWLSFPAHHIGTQWLKVASGHQNCSSLKIVDAHLVKNNLTVARVEPQPKRSRSLGGAYQFSQLLACEHIQTSACLCLLAGWFGRAKKPLFRAKISSFRKLLVSICSYLSEIDLDEKVDLSH